MVVLHRLLEATPNVIGQFDEFRIAAHFIGDARPGERHVEHFGDLSRPRRHHDDTIGEIDRFIHG